MCKEIHLRRKNNFNSLLPKNQINYGRCNKGFHEIMDSLVISLLLVVIELHWQIDNFHRSQNITNKKICVLGGMNLAQVDLTWSCIDLAGGSPRYRLINNQTFQINFRIGSSEILAVFWSDVAFTELNFNTVCFA